MTNALSVLWDGKVAGTLHLDNRGEMQFAYAPGWLKDRKSQALSFSLPKRLDPFGRRECQPFFEGMLPEELQRVAIARALGVSAGNDFRLLEHLGGEVAGALALLPEGEAPPKPSDGAPDILDDQADSRRRRWSAPVAGRCPVETPGPPSRWSDRKVDGAGRLVRLHQEDFAQALGVPSQRKYASEGGPTFRHIFGLLRSAATRPARDVLKLTDAAIFNLIIGNADAHAKNFSLLHAGATVRLAPLCDLLSTISYPELSAKLAMKIAKKATLEEIEPRH